PLRSVPRPEPATRSLRPGVDVSKDFVRNARRRVAGVTAIVVDADDRPIVPVLVKHRSTTLSAEGAEVVGQCPRQDLEELASAAPQGAIALVGGVAKGVDEQRLQA